MAPLLQDASKRSATVSKWLSWCGQRKNSVRVVEADIPAGIMPHKIDASLIDIKIGGKRGPDDALYNKSQVCIHSCYWAHSRNLGTMGAWWSRLMCKMCLKPV